MGMRAFGTAMVIVAAGLFVMAAPGRPRAQEAGAPAAAPGDPYVWLEDVHGPRVDAWVKAENAKTTAVLESDPRFSKLYKDDLAIAEAKDRVPTPQFIGGAVYNFWQDAGAVRGVWRRTSLASYLGKTPSWTTVLDLDALAAAEKANFVMKGMNCEAVHERRCLVFLSDGGEDAVVVREFDLATKGFVPGGFDLPKGKQTAAFSGDDEVLVAREWTPGEITSSGYPFVVKRVRRGAPLAQAEEVFRGDRADGGYGVTPLALADGDGRRAVLIIRPLTTFEAEIYIVGPKGVARLGLPKKVGVEALVKGRLILTVGEDWRSGGVAAPAGSLVSLDLTEVLNAPADLKPTIVFSPGPRQSVEVAAATRDRLIVAATDNVRGRAFIETPTAKGGWTRTALRLPDNASVGLVSTDHRGDKAFLQSAGYLAPTRTLLLDARTAALVTAKVLTPRFDASKSVVEQFEATSTDGVKIPYFIVHPRNMAADGSHPTILTAYGGFNISLTPRYTPDVGKLWIERGGVYVVANIRGGGEFGPAWHEAGLKTRRQIIYDDFRSVAEDLIARRITSPRRLGIMGGSNGGLLMGVEFTQHPELWRAVDIQVPLLDMVRFEKIAAGASWIGEYGSVDVPKERAFLQSISPYANLKTGTTYPEPFIWTTTKDDRVGPQHARKFAARLAEMGAPYLFFEVTEGGHGAGANLKESARTRALEMVYFTRKLMD